MPVFSKTSQNSIFTDTDLNNKSHTSKYSVVAHAIFSKKYFTYQQGKIPNTHFFVQNTFFGGGGEILFFFVC